MPGFGEEHDELRRAVRRLFEDRAPESRVRELLEIDEGYDKALWEQMAGQLGLHGLLVSEEYGGSGAGFVEVSVVIEEMGRALVGSPFLASAVLAATLLRELDDEDAAASLLPGIAAGSTIATVATAETPAAWGHDPLHPLTTTATPDGDGWELDGEKLFVLDGHVADVLFVTAWAGGGPSVFAVRADADGLGVAAMSSTDGTRRLASVSLDGTVGRLVGRVGAAGPAVGHVLDVCSAALCADAAGGALRLVELSAHYAGIRTQFGRVIGRNQAIKQKLADMVASVELARAAAHRVALAASADPAALPTEASMAKAFCADVYVQAAYDTIQVHGGIGFTWEHPAHLYLRRALGDAALFGTPDQHRELAANRLGL